MNWPAKRTFPEPILWDPFEDIRKTQESLNLLFGDLMPMKKWEGENVFTPTFDIKDKGNKLIVLPTCQESIKKILR